MRSARRGRSLLGLALGLFVGIGTPAALAVEPPVGLLETYAHQQPIDWEGAVEQLGRADVVFLGEQHDDPATHRLERALLESLHQSTRKRLVLSLEMFERDVQPILDAYLNGEISEAEFLAKSRPWPNYQRDYRPLISYAKENGIRVLAANVPRRLASKVAKEGPDVLNSLPPDERRWAASTLDCPKGRLWKRFQETMQHHPGLSEAATYRMYQAQCLKDATMAESIAQAMGPDAPPTLLLHLNGAFHSDEGLGVPAQLARIRPELRQVVTTVLPVDAPSPPPPGIADIVFLVSEGQP